jgi:hypothetical protein
MSIQAGMNNRIRQTSYIIGASGVSHLLLSFIFLFHLSKERAGGGSRVFDIYLGKFWIIWIMTFWYLPVFLSFSTN